MKETIVRYRVTPGEEDAPTTEQVGDAPAEQERAAEEHSE
jgi:hypothetical protein